MQLTICSLEELNESVESLLNGLADDCFLSEEKTFELKVVLNELIINAFTHDHVPCGLQVCVNAGQEDVLVSIGHDAHCFDPALAPSPRLYAENGRGLHIVKLLCSSVEFDAALKRIIACLPLTGAI